MDSVECIVVGAGVVGLAVARSLAQAGREVLVLEAADAIGTGQSSRNSEVVHAGLYYPPDWLKTRLCIEGRRRLYRFCAERGIECRKTGKLVVAASRDELGRLAALEEVIRDAGVPVERLDAGRIGEMEPGIVAEAALFSPESGIVDSHALMLALQADIEARGGVVALRSPVDRVSAGPDGGLRLAVGDGDGIACRVLVNSAGLGAQALARATDGMPPELVPPLQLMKGHYYTLADRSPFRHLVYPLPGENSLGIHVTHDLAGRARFGPDAVPVGEVDYGFDEDRRPVFVEAIRKYWPELDPARLEPAYTGIRAQLAHPGGRRRDYVISGPRDHGIGGLWHLFGIESPGLTACLAIGDHVADRVREGG